MRTEPETTRIVRSWLEEGRTALPDHLLDAVLADLPATRQRRPIWPSRRIERMNGYAKLAMAAAAVVVVVIVGYNLLPASTGVVGGPSPSPTASSTVAPSPSPTDPPFFPSGLVEAGRHSIVRSGKTLSVDLPAGWTSHIGARIYTRSGLAAFIFWTPAPTNVYADPCTKTPLDPAAGDAPADLAAAIASIPGTDLVRGPTDVTVGGHPAKLVTIKIREDIECAPGEFYLWYVQDPAEGRWPDALGDTINTWIIDVDGTTVWIDGEASTSSISTLEGEMQQIVDSIRFE